MKCQRCGRDFVRTSPRGPAPAYCSPTCRQRAYEERLRRTSAQRIAELELENKELRTQLAALRTPSPGSTPAGGQPSPRTVRPSPRKNTEPGQPWLLLQGQERERVALIGEYLTEAKATRACSQYWRHNPGAPEPVYVRNRSKVSRKMLLNPPADWARD